MLCRRSCSCATSVVNTGPRGSTSKPAFSRFSLASFLWRFIVLMSTIFPAGRQRQLYAARHTHFSGILEITCKKNGKHFPADEILPHRAIPFPEKEPPARRKVRVSFQNVSLHCFEQVSARISYNAVNLLLT